ncbi:DNA-processing protein DprA [Desulfobacterota bacterium M19]
MLTTTPSQDHLIDWLTLALVPGLGAVGMGRLIRELGEPEHIFAAGRERLLRVRGIRHPVADTIINAPPIREAELELQRLRHHNFSLLTWNDPAYPALLREIYNPPMLLYVNGDVGLLKRPSIAVVGSRAATSYGLKIGRRLGAELGARGLNVVSGLALGVDAAAHAAALEAGGITVAVLGCGLDVPYPRRNLGLSRRISAQGVIVSEYPMGTKPEAFRFPARNRIISGLALGVVVVEAAKRSGSLITARLAMDEGREVFAIPGRVDSAANAGAHSLLQQGAKLVYKIEDILVELSAHLTDFKAASHQAEQNKEDTAAGDVELTPEEKSLMKILEPYPSHIDSIIDRAAGKAAKVQEILLILELKGLVESLPGSQYRLSGQMP